MPQKKTKQFNLIKCFSVDHKLVLKDLRTLENCLDNPQNDTKLKKAAKLLNTIRSKMDIHFQKEEEVLFPILNRHFTLALKKMDKDIRPEGGPVNVMLLEHKSMRIIMQNLEQAIKNEKIKEISAFKTQLSALLRSHIFREENVLYIVADAKLKEKEKEKIAKRLLTVSKKAQE